MGVCVGYDDDMLRATVMVCVRAGVRRCDDGWVRAMATMCAVRDQGFAIGATMRQVYGVYVYGAMV